MKQLELGLLDVCRMIVCVCVRHLHHPITSRAFIVCWKEKTRKRERERETWIEPTLIKHLLCAVWRRYGGYDAHNLYVLSILASNCAISASKSPHQQKLYWSTRLSNDISLSPCHHDSPIQSHLSFSQNGQTERNWSKNTRVTHHRHIDFSMFFLFAQLIRSIESTCLATTIHT